MNVIKGPKTVTCKTCQCMISDIEAEDIHKTETLTPFGDTYVICPICKSRVYL